MAAALLASALAGWTLGLRAWAVFTLATSATWAFLAHRTRARTIPEAPS